MSRARRILGTMLLTAAAAAVITLADDDAPAVDGDTTYLVDRLWIERMPHDDRDMIGKLAVVRSLDHGRFGVIERGSVWRHMTEIFLWELDDNELHARFPQQREQTTIAVHTRDCEGEAPEPFELCLDILDKDGDAALTLYSRHQWVIRPRTDGGDLIEEPIVREWLDAIAAEHPADFDPQFDPQGPRDHLWPR